MHRRKREHRMAMHRVVKPPVSNLTSSYGSAMFSEEARAWKVKGLESVASALYSSRLKQRPGVAPPGPAPAAASLPSSGDQPTPARKLEQYKAAVNGVAAEMPGGDEEHLTLKYLLGKVGAAW